MSTLVRHSLMSGLAGLRHEPTAKRIRAIADSPDGCCLYPRGAAVGAAPGRALLGRAGRGHGRGAGGGEAGHPWGRRRRLPAARRVSAARSRPVDPVCGAHRRGGGRGHPPRVGGARRGWPAPRRSGPRRLRRARFRRLRQLVGGGRAECRAPAGSVPPHRCPAELAPGPARARARGAGGVGPASAAVRDDASDPLLPAPRGRQGGADPERDSNDLRLQGPGHASYLSPLVDGREVADLAWTYLQPPPDAAVVAGLVAFFDERVDLVLDGVRRERPVTPWSGRTPAEITS